MDFMKYDLKGNRDNKTETLQYVRRETFDINGNMILRLPEERDFQDQEDANPVNQFYRTKLENEKYFKMSPDERLDLS